LISLNISSQLATNQYIYLESFVFLPVIILMYKVKFYIISIHIKVVY